MPSIPLPDLTLRAEHALDKVPVLSWIEPFIRFRPGTASVTARLRVENTDTDAPLKVTAITAQVTNDLVSDVAVPVLPVTVQPGANVVLDIVLTLRAAQAHGDECLLRGPVDYEAA